MKMTWNWLIEFENVFGCSIEEMEKGQMEKLRGQLKEIGTERNIEIFMERFEKHKTLREIGNEYSITDERVAQICRHMLRKLERMNKVHDIDDIEDLCLSLRTYNALRRGGIRKIGDLLKTDRKQLLRVRNLGIKGVEEICNSMRKRGLTHFENGEEI